MNTLAFTLALQNAGFEKAVKQSTASEAKFTESIKAATARLKEQYGQLKNPPKLPDPPDPAPVEHHTQSLRHMRHELALVSEVAGQFGTELGALGRLAGLAFNPWLLAIGAVSIAIDLLKTRIQKLHESMVETIRFQQDTFNFRMAASAHATFEAAQANAAFNIELNQSANALDRISSAMERRIALFHATVEAQNRVLRAQQAARDAEIDRDESYGAISPVEAMRRHQAAAMSTQSAEFAAENRAAENEIREREDRLLEAQSRLANAENDHQAAVEAARRPHEAVEGQRGIVSDMERVRDQYQEQAREARASLADFQRLGVHRGALYERQAGILHDAETNATNAVGVLATGRQHLADLEREALFYDAATRAAAQRAEIEQRIVNEGSAQIDQQRQLLQIRQQEQAQTQTAENVANQALIQREQAEQARRARELFAVSPFERMGFSFGVGGPNAPTLFSQHPVAPLYSDHAARTANAAERTAGGIDQIVRALNQNPHDFNARQAWNALFQNAMP